jgi:hypothetical protein
MGEIPHVYLHILCLVGCAKKDKKKKLRKTAYLAPIFIFLT